MKLKVELKDKTKKINEVLKKSYDTDAGFDIILQEDITIVPGENKVDLGFKLELPQDLAGYIFPRSSWMAKGINFSVAPIDPFYSGNYHLLMYNMKTEDIVIKKGSRICQLVLMPFISVELCDSDVKKRQSNGIGSSGN